MHTIVDLHGLPVAVHVASASPHGRHLVPAPLDARFFADLPTRLIGDRGYDSDRLDDTLMTTYGIEMIAAHRRGRARTQDGRPLRRVRRRSKVERFFAWLTTRAEQSLGGNITSTLSRHDSAGVCAHAAPRIYEIGSSLNADVM